MFLLGVLTKSVGSRAAFAGVVAGLGAIAWVRTTPVAWTWYVLIGSAVTFATGYLASLLSKKEGHA